MKIYFSNKKLWNTYFVISISISVFLFLFLLLAYKSVFFVLLIIIAVFIILYAGFMISNTHKKVYIEIENNSVFLKSPIGNQTETFDLKSVKNLRKSGHFIIFVCENTQVHKIKLTYMNAGDTKKLINYLKYHPSIKNKKFFI